MRIYWYWPHPHRGPSPLALSMLRPDDELVVQALSSLQGESFGEVTAYRVVRDLPDPTAQRTGPLGRLRPLGVAAGRTRARRRLLREGFDLAHLQLLTYQTDWADLPALARRQPVVSLVHDVQPHRRVLPTRVERALLRRLYAPDCAGHLVVYHEVLRDELVGEFGVESARVSVLRHPGVEVRGPTIERRNPPFALLAGSLRQNKGIDVLLEALELLGPGTDVRVLAAGAARPDVAERLRDAAQRLPSLEVDLGWLSAERQHELFAEASLAVLPYTEFHSMSGVLVRAYTYRLPVVVSDVGALGPSVRDDRTGWVVSPRDPAQLAEALETAFAALDAGLDRRTALDAAVEAHRTDRVGPALRRVYDVAAAQWSPRVGAPPGAS